MATQKKTAKTTKKTVKAVPAQNVVQTPIETKTPSTVGLRTVLVFETGVLYFIILFILFVWNNFTILFFPK